MNNQRRYELDWLRVIAFGILIYFHAAIIFIPGGLPLIQNAETSVVANVLVDFSHQFRLGLLFLVSGAGVAFALGRRTNREFILERSRRLLIPLLFGILVLIPITVYFERLHLQQFSGSFIAFYPTFFTQGTYPNGNLNWHHFWFIAYLYIFCLLCLKFFSYTSEWSGQKLLDKVQRRFTGWRIYLFIIVLLIFELPLRAIFPGFRDLIHDWASFIHWLLLFVAGYVIAVRQELLYSIGRLRFVSLMGATVSTALLFMLFYGDDGFHLNINESYIAIKYISYCTIRMTMVWCCLLTCIGYAHRFLNFGHPILTYLNDAIYPLFIIHLTLIVAVGYFVTPLTWSIGVKYFVITTSTIIVGLLFYEIVIKQLNPLRILFGMKTKIGPVIDPPLITRKNPKSVI